MAEMLNISYLDDKLNKIDGPSWAVTLETASPLFSVLCL